MSQHKLTNLDPHQIIKYSFDESNNAQRVVIVGEGFNPTYNVTANSSGEIPKVIEVPHIIKEVQIKELQIPTIIKEIEIKEVQVPTIVKEVQIKEIQVPIVTQKIEIIEKPVIIKETEFKTIEIPIIVREVEIKEIEKYVLKIPQWLKILLAIESLALIGFLIANIIKN